jgi:hypothetical protein
MAQIVFALPFIMDSWLLLTRNLQSWSFSDIELEPFTFPPPPITIQLPSAVTQT